MAEYQSAELQATQMESKLWGIRRGMYERTSRKETNWTIQIW